MRVLREATDRGLVSCNINAWDFDPNTMQIVEIAESERKHVQKIKDGFRERNIQNISRQP